ncbi:MAG: hypothetical protein A2583_02060 [Bdellovibrionales bacterium RIFOXYD1_FULL_53_11]|nr:MAG: hypothetical protein A2583_02060 [Bdellovibrionales bacterium RIFOXYD1_FULL_53_11]
MIKIGIILRTFVLWLVTSAPLAWIAWLLSGSVFSIVVGPVIAGILIFLLLLSSERLAIRRLRGKFKTIPGLSRSVEAALGGRGISMPLVLVAHDPSQKTCTIRSLFGGGVVIIGRSRTASMDEPVLRKNLETLAAECLAAGKPLGSACDELSRLLSALIPAEWLSSMVLGKPALFARKGWALMLSLLVFAMLAPISSVIRRIGKTHI